MKRCLYVLLIICIAISGVGCKKGDSVIKNSSLESEVSSLEKTEPSVSSGKDEEAVSSKADSKNSSISKGSSSSENKATDKVISKTENVNKIDSLDKLNFYSAKQAIAQNEHITLSGFNKQINAMPLLNKRNFGILNLAESGYKDIDKNKVFTISMYCYFTVKLNNANGFLASKLGGTGLAEVVITKNNFENMITFKKGEKYYSCLQSSATDKAMSFSTHKYVNGFKLIENYERENYEFTVYFDSDKIIGMNCGRFSSNVDSFSYSPDDISFEENYCFVIHKTKSFTAKELESVFSSANYEDSQGVFLPDGTIMFGKSGITNKNVAIKEQNGKEVLKNIDITQLYAGYKKEYGYFIRLDLTSNGKAKLSNSLGSKEKAEYVIYLNNTLISEKFIKKENGKGSVLVIGFSDKAEMSKTFNALTVYDNSSKVGRIIDKSSFEREISKRINLKNYNLTEELYNSGSGNYIYERREKNVIEPDSVNYKFLIDGENIALPIKVSDFIAKGYKVVFESFDSDCRQGLLIFENGKGNQVTTFVMDYYGNAENMNSCYITQLNIYCYDNDTNYQEGINPNVPDFEAYGWLHKNSSTDDILSCFGEPNKIYLYTMNNRYNNHKMAHYQLYYSIATPDFPNAYVVINIFPVLNSDIPTDFITSISTVCH